MARTVKPEAFASKRREILDAAQRLVFTKGYEQMSIQDILDDVRISSGAFHHYFGSGSHENVRPFKIIAMEKQVQTSIMHQKRFGEGERLANKTS